MIQNFILAAPNYPSMEHELLDRQCLLWSYHTDLQEKDSTSNMHLDEWTFFECNKVAVRDLVKRCSSIMNCFLFESRMYDKELTCNSDIYVCFKLKGALQIDMNDDITAHTGSYTFTYNSSNPKSYVTPSQWHWVSEVHIYRTMYTITNHCRSAKCNVFYDTCVCPIIPRLSYVA